MSEMNPRTQPLLHLRLIITADFSESAMITRLSVPNSRIRETQ